MTDNSRIAARHLISKRAHAVTERVRLAVRPLFVEERKALQLVGSGILLKIGDETFLLSAAHVLDERHKGLFMLDGDNLLPLTGEYISSSQPPEGRDADNIDVGAVRLSGAVAHASQLAVLNTSDLDVDERTLGASTKQYLVIGYPASKAKPRRATKSVKAEGLILTSLPVPANTYARLGLHDFSHLVLHSTSVM